MASSGDPELKGGFSLSQWMKAKPSNGPKGEFEPFAASPPAHDDSFFYIRYPKPETLFPSVGKGSGGQTPSVVVQEAQASASAVPGKEVDWTRHTKSCRDVLHGIPPGSIGTKLVTLKPKPAGTDDGFKGEGAACGSSVLKVAHKMVSSNRTASQRGFTVAAPVDEAHEDHDEPGALPGGYNLAARRGSRSLPVSPMHSPPGSPNSRRKNKNANGYFTSPFEPSESGDGRSWLLAALLGYKKDIEGSTSTLAEDEMEARLQDNSLTKSTLMQSVESLGPAPRSADPRPLAQEPHLTQDPRLTKPASAFRPKPTEFREMNFWSPTSM